MSSIKNGGVANPLTPEQSKAQVIDAAQGIVGALKLQVIEPAFWHASCNDQGEAPFRGQMTIGYPRAASFEASDAEVAQMAASSKYWLDRGSRLPEPRHGAQEGRRGRPIRPAECQRFHPVDRTVRRVPRRHHHEGHPGKRRNRHPPTSVTSASAAATSSTGVYCVRVSIIERRRRRIGQWRAFRP